MNTERFTARRFISSCSGLSNPCTTITNLVTDLQFDTKNNGCRLVGWLVGFEFNGPLRQYFSLYRAVSQREGERGEKGQTRVKICKQPPPAPTASAVGPCPIEIQIVGRPSTGSLPSTIAPPDHPHGCKLVLHFVT